MQRNVALFVLCKYHCVNLFCYIIATQMKKVNNNIKPGLARAIEFAGGSQIKLAKKAGVSHQAVSRWVKAGRISDRSLRKVAKALNVSPLSIGDFAE